MSFTVVSAAVDADRLKQLRDGIDSLDQQILGLVAERLKLVLTVGELKREHGIKVYDAGRERRVLDRIAQRSPEPLKPDVARRIFERIIDESRSQEMHHIDEV